MSIILPFRRIIPVSRPPVIPGSASYTTPGTYSLVIPQFNNLGLDVRGAGGGGQGAPGWVGFNGATNGGVGGNGGYSQVYLQQDSGLLNVVGYGGQGGQVGATGTYGTGQGGDQNITGGGSAGGSAGYMAGGDPTIYGTNGGYGGRATRNQPFSVVAPGMTLIIIVGAAGPPGANATLNTPFPFYQVSAGYGAAGAVYISWS